ncbi:MAG: hypothetical protein CL920_38485 [Deltaproteobacteria bacterium]|nr:hypothetical protein [Deltaproteobacteria bacterium]
MPTLCGELGAKLDRDGLWGGLRLESQLCEVLCTLLFRQLCPIGDRKGCAKESEGFVKRDPLSFELCDL